MAASFPSSNPTIILVPGSWHTTAHVTPLINSLSRLNHTSKAIQLASVGLKSPRPTFASDVQAVQGAVRAELQAGKDVCLVLHSVAGVSGAEAINQLYEEGLLQPETETETERKGRGKLLLAIFIAAYVFPAGMVFDARDFVGPENPGFSIDDDGILHMDNTEQAFFNDLPPATAKPWVEALEPAYYLGREPLITSDNWRRKPAEGGVPIAALLCKRDQAVPPERQEMLWGDMECEWIDAGHTPYVSRPEEVAGFIVGRLGAGGRRGEEDS